MVLFQCKPLGSMMKARIIRLHSSANVAPLDVAVAGRAVISILVTGAASNVEGDITLLLGGLHLPPSDTIDGYLDHHSIRTHHHCLQLTSSADVSRRQQTSADVEEPTSSLSQGVRGHCSKMCSTLTKSWMLNHCPFFHAQLRSVRGTSVTSNFYRVPTLWLGLA